jgi:hypothetical protein
MKVEFSRQRLEKKTQTSSFIKIRPVGAELFHAAWRTDGHESKRRFSQFLRMRLKTDCCCSEMKQIQIIVINGYTFGMKNDATSTQRPNLTLISKAQIECAKFHGILVNKNQILRIVLD